LDKSSLDTTTQSKVFVKSLNGLKWNYIGTFIKMFTQYVVVILLMRLVGPQAYGTMAIALSIIALGNLLNDSGLGAFIVQNPQLTKDDIKSCFTIQIFMSLIVALSVFLGSNLVSNYFNNNELALVLKLLSISFILQAYGVISFNLLKKEFKFKNIQIANISSYIISYAVIGLILAFNNWGVLSLVYAQISQAFLNSLMLYFFTKHSLKLKFVFTKKYLKYYRFGLKALATNITNWLIDSLGTFSMGKVYGAINLGFYNRTFTLLMYPITFVVNMIQTIMFPLYSKFQDDEKLTKQTFLSTVFIVALFMIPISLVLIIFRYEIFRMLFGEYGAKCASIALPVIISLPFISLTNICGPLFWGRGNIERELKAQIKTVIIYVILIFIFMNFEFNKFIWITLVVYISRFFIIVKSVLKYLTLPTTQYLKAFFPAIRVGLIVLIISIFVKWLNLEDIFSLISLGSMLAIILGLCFIKKRNIYYPPNIERSFFELLLRRGG